MSTKKDYGIEIEDRVWLPADGHDVYYFPDPDRRHGHAERVTRVTMPNGKTWYAATSTKRERLDVFVMPGGKRLFIRGVVVEADNPLRWDRVPLEDVKQCMVSPDGNIAVMCGQHSAAGYDRDGLRWLSPLDHLELIKFTKIDNDKVFVHAWVDPDMADERPIALDIWSGREIFADRPPIG